MISNVAMQKETMTSELDPMSIANQDVEAEWAEADLEVEPSQDVEITTEHLGGRKRQIAARIEIPHSVTQIWQILTDYDHLADFIPSLAKSRQLEDTQGRIRIEQVGTQSLLKIKFCARVVLEMVERFPHQLDFTMVEGDFKQFSGNWTLQPLADDRGTELIYTLQVVPALAMPVGMIERRLQSGLVVNLRAIRDRADVLFNA